MEKIKEKTVTLLKKTEAFTKTDMSYVASGGFWVNLNFVVSSFFAFALSIALAHYVPKEAYGHYQYILSLAAIFTAFSLTGMNSALTQSVARGFEGSLVESVMPQLKWGVLSSLSAFIGAVYYAGQGAYPIAISLFIVSIFLPITNTANTYTAYFTGKKDFKSNFKYSTAFNAIYSIVLVITVIYTQNPVFIVFSYFLTNSAINTFLFLRTLKISGKDRPSDPETLPYAKHLSLMNIIVVIANRIDSVLVFHFLGATTLALYTFAKIIPEKIGGALKSFASIAFPKFAEQDKITIHNTLLRRTLLFTILSVGASLSYILIAPFVFKTFFPKYIESIFYSQIFSLTLIGAAAALPNYALMAQKLKKELYLVSTINPIFQLALLTSMLYVWGIWGLIYSKIISSAIYLAISTYLAHKETKAV